jgi:integrase
MKKMREQGQGAIIQRGKASWRLKFDLGRDPVTGERQTRYVTFKGTKREAQAELTRLLNQKNEGTYVDPTKMSVGEWLEHWLSVSGGWSAKTAQRHRQIVRNNIIPRLGHVPLRALRATHIEAFEAELQREGYLKGKRKGEGLTAQTALHVHRTLSQALAHAVKTEVLFKNPAEQVRAPRPQGREIKILGKPDVAKILRVAEGTTLYVPVLVGAVTGLRRGELFGLRWSDLDLAKGRLTVNQSLEYVKGPDGQLRAQFKPPKTRTSRRTLTLPGLAVEALKGHRATQAQERLALGLGKAELVFTRADGSPASLNYITKAFNALIAEAGVTRITFHGLRHTHISHQLMDGVHVKLVSERAGHANVNVTLTVYAAYIPSLADAAAEGINAWLGAELAKAGEEGANSVPTGPVRAIRPPLSD